MTATAPDALTCPNCKSINTMRTADGNALCFDCRTEWDPATITTLPAPVTQPVAEWGAKLMEENNAKITENVETFEGLTVDNVLGAPIEVLPADAKAADAALAEELEALADQVNADANAMLDSLIGGTATLEGGQGGIVVAFVDDETLAVQLADGRVEHVNYADVESIVAAPTAATALTVDVDDATAAAIASADLSIAALILKAGIATLKVVDGAQQVGTPPEGFLDPDPEMFPIIERGAATAAAMLILVCGVDVDALLRTIATWGTEDQK